ncbi:uncharacterized protein LOC117639629 [Thrips palmi]|uniref:Uncharacterized protein LOC117639629 n=1 Tax=Thrips palmi TaxID=161013 RepID=A0A6P8XWH4_THRPL|nr:uncharacterized protein LOC117639629 [Thrips palmi]
MNTCVKTFTANEHQLFNIPRFVEDIEQSNASVKEAGVFKVVLEDSIKGKGSPLKIFLNLDKERLAEAYKQFAVHLPHCSSVFALRSYPHSRSEPGKQVENEMQQCSAQDITNFVDAVTNEKNYTMSSCCSSALEKSENDLVKHFYSDVLPKKAIHLNRSGPSLSKLKKQGECDAASLRKFFDRFQTLAIGQKKKVVDTAMSKDTRITEEVCSCSGCATDNVSCEGSDLKKGVMYGSGIELTFNDRIRMSPHFGLYCLASTSLLRLLPNHYPGITLPFLYYGNTHSFFAAHIEDFSLYSWNVLHYGAPKIWLVIPPKYVRKLHNCLVQCTQSLAHSTCSNLLGHKYYVITPQWLQEYGIPFNVVVQRAGESVVVCPNAVHVGFNSGFNIAEACNFATESWIPYGIVAPQCKCMGFEAHLDIARLVAATRPDLLENYTKQTMPVVPKEEDPYFYSSILKEDKGNNLRESSSEKNETEENEEDVAMPQDEHAMPAAPAVPSRPVGRKVVCCPKPSCSKEYGYGKTKRMRDHVDKCHSNDRRYQQYIKKLDALYPPRNKTKRQTCLLCGKSVAGTQAQMTRHKNGSKCDPSGKKAKRSGVHKNLQL